LKNNRRCRGGGEKMNQERPEPDWWQKRLNSSNGIEPFLTLRTTWSNECGVRTGSGKKIAEKTRRRIGKRDYIEKMLRKKR